MANKEIDTAHQIITQTRHSVFLTGKAGTGKTTFLRRLRTENCKRMVVLAPTGIAAINAGGSTLHSFFQLPFSPYIPGANYSKETFRINRKKLRMIRSLDLIVIDEISMVRSDLLDSVDAVLRRIRRSELPFGGVQLLMIGDLSQLAPVVTDEEWQLLSRHYTTPYFFSSHALSRLPYTTIELTHVYRQSDEHFIALLNSIREGNVDASVLNAINRRYKPDFHPEEGKRYIRLVTHNRMADMINRSELERIPNPAFTFSAQVKGNFPSFSFPTEDELTLKKGAQVMFVKNDPEHRYVNGTIGIVSCINPQGFTVRVERSDAATAGSAVVKANETGASFLEIDVCRDKWENTRYSLNEKTAEIEEVVDGQFLQYPVKLAWAITIHKSQGLTFDHAILDVSHSFAHGQAYVALSRLRTFEGLVLSAPIPHDAIIIDPVVRSFLQSSRGMPDDSQMQGWICEGWLAVISELYDFSAVRRELEQLTRLVDRYLPASRYPRLAELCQETTAHFSQKVEDVARKFSIQYTSLVQADANPAANSLLGERLQKAATYFSATLSVTQQNVNALLDICAKAQNKEVKKHTNEHRQQFAELFRQRIRLLEYVRDNGLDQVHYPTCRTRILCGMSVEPGEAEQNPKQKIKTGTSLPAANAAFDDEGRASLYESLRAWRLRRATEQNRPAFQILSNQVLQNITQMLPADRESLLSVAGIGQVKADAYGDEIIRQVRQFLEHTGRPDAEQ